jgi:hypothetical protein
VSAVGLWKEPGHDGARRNGQKGVSGKSKAQQPLTASAVRLTSRALEHLLLSQMRGQFIKLMALFKLC